MTLNAVIALILRFFSRNSTDFQAVVEDRPIMSVKFCLTVPVFYTVFQKSDAKIQITITTAYLIRIKYAFSGFNDHLSDVNVANFN